MDEAERPEQVAATPPDGQPPAVAAAQSSGAFNSFVAWATRAQPQPAVQMTGPMPRRGLRVAAFAAGGVSLALVGGIALVGLVAGSPIRIPSGDPVPTAPVGPQAVAGQLAEQADGLGRDDPMRVLQLRLAAYTLDPGNAAGRAALAELLLGPRPLATVSTTVGSVTAIAVSADGRLAIGGSSGVQEATGEPPSLTLQSPAASADVPAVAYDDANQLVAATNVGVVATDGRAAATVLSTEDVAALERLGSTGWAATTRDGRLVMWDDGMPTGSPTVLAAGLGSSAPLAATVDGAYLFAPGSGGVAVWDTGAGHVAATLPIDSKVTALSIDDSGERLLVGHSGGATLWNMDTPTTAQPAATIEHPGGVSAAAIAPDGRTATTSGGGSTTVWELPDSGDPLPVANLPVGGTGTVAAYSPDSMTVATGNGSTVHLWSVRELVFYRPTEVQPTVKLRSHLPLEEPITYMTVNEDGTYVLAIDDPAEPATLWSTRTPFDQTPELDRVGPVDAELLSASMSGPLLKTTLLTVSRTGRVARWLVTNGILLNDGAVTESADTAALTPDGNTAVLVDGTTGTVFALVARTRAIATLSYPAPTTVLAFAPQGTTLIAGHDDGTVTVHSIDLAQRRASRRTLTSDANTPVDAVALSGNAAVALAAHTDGRITVWNLTQDDTGVTIDGAAGTGAHRVRLDPTGTFATVSDRHATSLWSLVDRDQPTRLATLVTSGEMVPAAVSADGTTAVDIDLGNQLTLWDLRPVLGVADNPTVRACQLADLDHERWRELVPDTAYNTPCQPPPLPQIDDTAPSSTSAVL